jgi:hypothetical protein
MLLLIVLGSPLSINLSNLKLSKSVCLSTPRGIIDIDKLNSIIIVHGLFRAPEKTFTALSSENGEPRDHYGDVSDEDTAPADQDKQERARKRLRKEPKNFSERYSGLEIYFQQRFRMPAS